MREERKGGSERGRDGVIREGGRREEVEGGVW